MKAALKTRSAFCAKCKTISMYTDSSSRLSCESNHPSLVDMEQKILIQDGDQPNDFSTSSPGENNLGKVVFLFSSQLESEDKHQSPVLPLAFVMTKYIHTLFFDQKHSEFAEIFDAIIDIYESNPQQSIVFFNPNQQIVFCGTSTSPSTTKMSKLKLCDPNDLIVKRVCKTNVEITNKRKTFSQLVKPYEIMLKTTPNTYFEYSDVQDFQYESSTQPDSLCLLIQTKEEFLEYFKLLNNYERSSMINDFNVMYRNLCVRLGKKYTKCLVTFDCDGKEMEGTVIRTPSLSPSSPTYLSVKLSDSDKIAHVDPIVVKSSCLVKSKPKTKLQNDFDLLVQKYSNTKRPPLTQEQIEKNFQNLLIKYKL